MMTNAQGCPVALHVYAGNTADPSTVGDQVNMLRKRFGLTRVVLVGDRGMLTQARIEEIRKHPELGWISALPSKAIRRLVDQEGFQRSLFDEYDLAEITSPDYPGERLMVCYNPLLADERKRQDLLEATQVCLEKIVVSVQRRVRKPMSREDIGLRVGKIISKYRMAKHFKLTIEEGFLQYERSHEAIEKETALDGIYVIRTSESQEDMSCDQTVRNSKGLSQVERAFRSMKSTEIDVRPIFHYNENHVRAHIFLCMLAYYVQWHMRQRLKPLLYDDEELTGNCDRRHPVRPAVASESAKRKKCTRKTEDGFEVQTLSSLISALGMRCRNICRMNTAAEKQLNQGKNPLRLTKDTEFTPLQKKAMTLLGLYPVAQK